MNLSNIFSAAPLTSSFPNMQDITAIPSILLSLSLVTFFSLIPPIATTGILTDEVMLDKVS